MAKSLALPAQLVPDAARIGFHEVYVNLNKVFGRVYIGNKCYHVLQDRINHYLETGELHFSKQYYESRVKMRGVKFC